MMTLIEAASFFNKQTFTDAYGSANFLGQIIPFAESVRSGISSLRRILEVASSVTLPSRMTVKESSSNQVYLVASGADDYFSGNVIRVKHPVVPVDQTVSVASIDGILTTTYTYTGLYVDLSYLRRVPNEMQQSHFESNYLITHESTVQVLPRIVFKCGSKYFFVREASRIDDIGLGTTEAVEVISPLQTLTYQKAGSTYSAANDTYTQPAAITGVSCFVIDAIFDYDHIALGFEKIKEGDKSISFLKTAVDASKPGDTVGSYKVIEVVDNSTYWTVLGRR